jgi:hypothetical protein
LSPKLVEYIFLEMFLIKKVFPFEDLHENARAKLRQESLLLPSSLLPSHGSSQEDHDLVERRMDSCQNIATELVKDPMLETEALGAPSKINQDSLAIIGTETQVYPLPVVSSHVPSATVHTTVSPEQCSRAPVLLERTESGQVVTKSTISGSSSEFGVNEVPGDDPAVPTTGDGPVVSTTGLKIRSKSGIFKPKIYMDGAIRYSLFSSTGEPQTSTKHWVIKIGRQQWILSFKLYKIIKLGIWCLL